MSKFLRTSSNFIEHTLDGKNYQPLIPGQGTELLERLKTYSSEFPHTTNVFSTILETHVKKHPLLEDWLLIPHFQFFWDSDKVALQWFENLYTEAHNLLGCSQWNIWLEELVKQTNCPTTHTICDRLYDYQLQLCGAIYLARNQWSVQFIPQKNKEKTPDVIGLKNDQKCVLESKFVHTSEKYDSFCHRFIRAVAKYVIPRPPSLFNEQFRFPSALEIKAISPLTCTMIKAFIGKVYEDLDQPQKIVIEENPFTYAVSLPPAVVTLDIQQACAHEQATLFVNNYLKRLLLDASKQLHKPEYDDCEKILFIGFQPDALYLAPWNESFLSVITTTFEPIAATEGITSIFSDYVNFSARHYV